MDDQFTCIVSAKQVEAISVRKEERLLGEEKKILTADFTNPTFGRLSRSHVLMQIKIHTLLNPRRHSCMHTHTKPNWAESVALGCVPPLTDRLCVAA